MENKQDARPFIDLQKDAEEFRAKFEDDIERCKRILNSKITTLICDPDSLGNSQGIKQNALVEFSKAKYDVYVSMKSLINEMEREWLKYISEMKKLFIDNVEVFLANTKLEVKFPSSGSLSPPGHKSFGSKSTDVTGSIYPIISNITKSIPASLCGNLIPKKSPSPAHKQSSLHAPMDTVHLAENDEEINESEQYFSEQSSCYSHNARSTDQKVYGYNKKVYEISAKDASSSESQEEASDYESKHLTTLLDSNGQHNSTQSSILMNAKIAASAPYHSQSSLDSLLFDYSKLLEDESSSDVTLTCGDRKFFAHRIILTARSEVFASMFRNNMVESKTGNIDITDMEAEVLDILLKYVYIGKISDLTVNTADKLYMAADKYSILSLKDECSKWMLGNLTKENCLDFLYLAESCSDERFKERLISFVAQILVLLKGEAWLKFSDKYPKLAISIYERRVLYMNPV